MLRSLAAGGRTVAATSLGAPFWLISTVVNGVVTPIFLSSQHQATLKYDDWAAALRELAPGYQDIDRAIASLSRPGALTASMNWYRANLAPRMPGPRPELPPVTAPTLGIWSDGDRYLDGARMRASGDLVKGSWRYAQINGATHWIPLDAPAELNDLLLDWLTSSG